MQPSSRRAQHGFTLVEVLVAMTIMGLMMGVLFGSLHLAARAWDSGEERMEEAGDLVRAQNFLRDRISLARPIPVPDHLGRASAEHVLFHGEARSLYFVAPMPAHRGGGGLHLAEVAHVEGERMTFSHRLYHGNVQSITEGDWRTNTLLEDVETIRFRYFGRREGDNRRRWHASWTGQPRLPERVELRVDRSDLAYTRWPTLISSTEITERAGRASAGGVGFGP